MKYFHVDVFSDRPARGNGLTVVFADPCLPDERMQEIAREFRQFETAFVIPDGTCCNGNGERKRHEVRIFTMDEELPFAGHPLLGTAAVLHHAYYHTLTQAPIPLRVGGRDLNLTSASVTGTDPHGADTFQLDGRFATFPFSVTMDQGLPDLVGTVPENLRAEVAAALGLDAAGLDPRYPVEVVSAGLAYLIVPVKMIDRVRPSRPDFEAFIARFGAKFSYAFDPETLECRSWDNAGLTEDVATGSAAGPLCAYLVRHGLARSGVRVDLHQGRFCGRPSVITTWIDGSGSAHIEGTVALFAEGTLRLSPAPVRQPGRIS